MPSAPYTCAECDAPASVEDGKVVRSCAHGHAAVIAHMDAVAYGEGHTEEGGKKPGRWLLELWTRLFGPGDLPLACLVCGAPAVRKDNRILRACAHTTAEVVGGRV